MILIRSGYWIGPCLWTGSDPFLITTQLFLSLQLSMGFYAFFSYRGRAVCKHSHQFITSYRSIGPFHRSHSQMQLLLTGANECHRRLPSIPLYPCPENGWLFSQWATAAQNTVPLYCPHNKYSGPRGEGLPCCDKAQDLHAESLAQYPPYPLSRNSGGKVWESFTW